MASLVKTALCALACLALVAAAPRSQINVGKSQGDNSYVANGIANPLYAPGSPNPQVVTMYTPWLEMFVSLSGGADQEYLAIAANSNSTVLSATVDPVTDWGKVTTKRQVAVRVMLMCTATGQDTFNVTISFPGFDSVVLGWSKVCRTGDAHTGFSVATYDWSAATNTSDVVTDGLVMPLWMGDDQTGQFNLIDAATNQATFYLWVTQGSAQAYNIVSTVGDANLLAISVDQQFGLARPVNQGFQTAKFTVTFTCGQSNGFGFVSLSVSVDPFDPFTIAWFKNCQGAVVPGGMSATGVFFLTVFLLTLFGCMGGCAFKYVKLHARGVEVIPGIDTWRGLYARCKNGGGAAPGYDGVVYKSSVGPQSQFDAPIQDQHAATAGASSASSSNPFGSYQNI